MMIKVTGISTFDYYGRGWVTFDVDGTEVKMETAVSTDHRFEPTEYYRTLNSQIADLVNMQGDDGFWMFCGERDIDDIPKKELKKLEKEYDAYLFELEFAFGTGPDDSADHKWQDKSSKDEECCRIWIDERHGCDEQSECDRKYDSEGKL